MSRGTRFGRARVEGDDGAVLGDNREFRRLFTKSPSTPTDTAEFRPVRRSRTWMSPAPRGTLDAVVAAHLPAVHRAGHRHGQHVAPRFVSG